MCVSAHVCASAPWGGKVVSDPLELEFWQMQAAVGSQEQSLGPLEESPLFLTSEPSLWPSEGCNYLY